MARFKLVGGQVVPLTSDEETQRDADEVDEAVKDAENADPDVIAERAIVAEYEASAGKRLLFEVLFDHENRIRALEGFGTITKAQYRAALLSRLQALPTMARQPGGSGWATVASW